MANVNNTFIKWYLLSLGMLFCMSTFAFDIPNGNFDKELQKYKNTLKSSSSLNKDEITLGIELLSLDYAPFITSLNRKIKTYNFRDQSFLELNEGEINSMAWNSPKGVKYANEWSEAIKNNTLPHTGMLGWGFYTANNTQTSAHFSNSEDKFALVTLDYPKDAVLLDTRALALDGMLPLSNETFEYLSKLCKIDPKELKTSKIAGYSTISKVVLTKSDKCNQIFIKTLDQFKIDAIAYHWAGAKSSICDSSTVDPTAFINVNGKINRDTTKLYINPTDDLFDESLQITEGEKKPKNFSIGEEAFMAYSKLAVNFSSYDIHPFKDDLGGFFPKDQKLKKKFENEIKSESFGCSKTNEKSDAPTYRPEQAVALALKKKSNSFDPNGILENFKLCPN